MTTPPTTRARTRKVDPDEFDVREEKTAPFDTDDEEEAPRPRRRRPVQDEEATVPTKRKRPVQDLDDEETGDEEAEGEETVVPIHRGRAAIKSNRPSADGSLYFKWSEDGEAQVVKFMDEAPWSYDQHWVERAGKKSFPCIGKNCPLCEIGAKVTQKIVYSLVNLSLPEPAVQVLEVTPTLDDTLATYDGDKKTGPLPRLYWAVSRTKAARSSNTFAKYNYVFTPIKERDLEEDYQVSLDDAEAVLEKAEIPAPEKVLGKVNRRVLQEIANEVMGEH